MLGSDDNPLPKVADFYHGKSIFLTGASGFIGSVILEILLRCCPGIESIYILIRPKKNEKPEVRKDKIFNKKIFDRVKEENKDIFKKVHLISGDLMFPNLGINEGDLGILIEEISIVFHCAANVQMKNPLKFMLTAIVLSLDTLIKLCREMKKLEALVYTSTAYSNCNRPDAIIMEEVYRIPFRTEKFLKALRDDDNELLQQLSAHCKPDWPNTYVFSKSVAENLITDTALDLPIAIIRPSIVISTWKNPIPGYQEGQSGIAAISFGIGKGIIRVLHADPNNKMNLVPVDIVANAHVLAACCIGTKGCASPLIVNCTASEKLHIKISEYTDIIQQLFRKFPLPQAYADQANVRIEPNRYIFYILIKYHHHLPATFLDVMLKLTGKRTRLCSLYSFVDVILMNLRFFMFHTINFDRKNLEALDELIHPEDKKDLTLDFKDASFREMASKLPEATHFFDWQIDNKCPSERQRIKYRNYVIITCIQYAFLMICFLFIIWIFSLIFM